MNQRDKEFVSPAPAKRPAAYEIEIMRNRLFKSKGVTPSFFDVGPVLEGLAPCLDQLVVHLVCDERSSEDLDYQVTLFYSPDGVDWTQGGDIIPVQNDADYTISDAFTTRTQFGRFIKVQLGLVDAGVACTARFSMWLDVKLWT
ncbi:MAG: hypothetical protein ABIO70_03845 [Pseudomonadota bacterium]